MTKRERFSRAHAQARRVARCKTKQGRRRAVLRWCALIKDALR